MSDPDEITPKNIIEDNAKFRLISLPFCFVAFRMRTLALASSNQCSATESESVGSVRFWPSGSESVTICTDPDMDPDSSINKPKN
jgi:hypothetical protein